LLVGLFGDEGDEPSVGRPLETLNGGFVRGQWDGLSAHRIEQKDLRARVGVVSPLRQKGDTARVGRPSRRIVTFWARGQTDNLSQLVNQPDIRIEPVVFSIPRTDDKSNAARVRRQLSVAGAV